MITTRNFNNNSRKTMKSNSQRIINTIKQKVKNPMTGGKFTNNDQIVVLVVESFFERLKKQRFLRFNHI